jgi:glycosyltransferase involved in cell wall biosynthesis
VNVLVVSRCLPLPLHHGDRLILYHLLRGLGQRGHELDVLAFSLDANDAAELPDARDLARSVEVIPEHPRSPAHYVRRLLAGAPRTPRQCWSPAMATVLRDRLAARRYDVVHFFGGIQVYEFGFLAAGTPRIIVPYESHGLLLERAVAAATGIGERLRLRGELAGTRRFERTMYRGFDRVVLICDVDAGYLRRLAPDLPIVVIPNGVDGEYFAPRAPAGGPPALIFVGNFAYGPNQRAATSLVREVLPSVRETIPEIRLTLVGASPPPPIERLAGDGVTVTGWVPDIRPYLAAATCFVSPLAQGAGLRNKILEAMAMGVPVVATPLSCDGIGVTPGRDVLLGATPAALARQVVALLGDETLRQRVGQAGRALVTREYTWETVASRYETLYAEVAAPGRATVAPRRGR